MTDRVFIRHPTYPERNGYVTQTAFDHLWSKKGYVVEGDGTGDPIGESGPETVEVPAGTVVAPSPTVDQLNDELDEKDQLRRRLEAHGIEVDGRWGVKRLRTEAAGLDDVASTCSVCDAPAVYEIEDAPGEKGNLACEAHRGMWPLSQARRLSTGTAS